MPPDLALILCVLFILYLLVTDRQSKGKVTRAIWIPAIWMMILGTREVSSWFNLGLRMESPDVYLEGSPFDRAVYTILLVAGLIILWVRRLNWSEILRRNRWLLVFFVYCGISVLWSEFPIVSLKRWIKQVANIVMILIIVTEADPVEAVKTLIRRCTYILIPMSVVLIKYYPDLGRLYDRWTGEVQYSGVAYNKNALGYSCLVWGYFFFWSFLNVWRRRKITVEKKELFLDGLFLILICWLLWISRSMTSLMGFIIGCAFLIFITTAFVRRNITFVGVYLIVSILLITIVVVLGDIFKSVVTEMGRDITLTGRTELWKELMTMVTNPWLGAGFESFWLGERAKELWEIFAFRPNQAHNGYLEIYLDLGWAGLCLLFGVILNSYNNIRKGLMSNFDYGGFRLGFLLITLFYNFTEAAFKGLHLVWFMFLLISVEYSRVKKSTNRVKSVLF